MPVFICKNVFSTVPEIDGSLPKSGSLAIGNMLFLFLKDLPSLCKSSQNPCYTLLILPLSDKHFYDFLDILYVTIV